METMDKKAKFAQIAFLMASLPLNQEHHCSDEIVHILTTQYLANVGAADCSPAISRYTR